MQVAGIREPLDPVIVEKLSELSQEGVHSVSEARRYLELSVQCDLFKGCTPPDKTSRRFYPTNKDIYNHLHKGKPNHFSSLDQKNLEELVQNWKKDHPEDSFLYRPHATKPASDDSSHCDDDSTTPTKKNRRKHCCSVIRLAINDIFLRGMATKCAWWMQPTEQQNMIFRYTFSA